MFKKYLEYLYKKTVELNRKNIKSQLEVNPEAKYLDLGCNDGQETIKNANIIRTKKIYGIEIIKKQAGKAKEWGMNVWIGDLNKKWKYPNNYFDVITANQVIEHVSDVDHFITEIKRVLKKGGYTIISTENGSSWHNIFASIMGWQTFSLTAISIKMCGIGNPLALHRKKKNKNYWTHKTIFNYLGLKEILELYNFKIGSCLGSGYHPFPPIFGSFDIKHSHYLSFKIQK